MGPLLLMLALAGAAPAPATGASSFCPGRSLANPHWIARPTGVDITRFYPPHTDGPTGGRVVMDCVVKADGGLGGCTLVLEEPLGAGFGAATLKLAGRFRLEVQTPEGRKTVGQHVCIPVRWETADEAPATSQPPPPRIVPTPPR
jgi:hypothetical protein